MQEPLKKEPARRPDRVPCDVRSKALSSTTRAGKGVVTSSKGRVAKSTGGEALSLLELAGPLRVLADPTRLQILESLLGGVQCNCNIKKILGLPMNTW